MTLGFKYGRVAHAKDWDDVPNVIASISGPATLGKMVIIQHGSGWARAVFGYDACVYSHLADLQAHFPKAPVVEFKGTFSPPPMPQ